MREEKRGRERIIEEEGVILSHRSPLIRSPLTVHRSPLTAHPLLPLQGD
jgi:hypothetical protein